MTERAVLIAAFAAIAGDKVILVRGRARVEVPLEDWLARVSDRDISAALHALRMWAGVVARAVATLEPFEFVLWCARNRPQEVTEADKLHTEGAVLRDADEAAFDGLSPDPLDEASRVRVEHGDAARQPHDKLLEGGKEGVPFGRQAGHSVHVSISIVGCGNATIGRVGEGG